MAGGWVEALRRLNRRTRDRPAIRRLGVATYRSSTSLVRWRVGPRVLLNGPAKSGTHLLADAVGLLPSMSFSGRHLEPHEFRAADGTVDEAALADFLAPCRNGFFVTAHAPHSDAFENVVTDAGFRHVLLLRDPRDIAVSLARYITEHAYLPRHPHFAAMADDGARLLAVVEGYDPPGGGGLPPLSQSLAAYVPWCSRPDVLVVRFEDLVGPRGGGDESAQTATVAELARHVGRPISDERASVVAAAAFATTGLTFREGRAGGWRAALDDEVAARFETALAEVVADYGYA